MKVGRDKVRLEDGSMRKFRSEAARDAWLRVAEAIKHGWHPTGAGRKTHDDGSKR